MAGAAAAVSPPVEKADATAWIAVAAGALGAMLATLDISIVNSALPTIQGEIGATGTEGTWIATAFLVAGALMSCANTRHCVRLRLSGCARSSNALRAARLIWSIMKIARSSWVMTLSSARVPSSSGMRHSYRSEKNSKGLSHFVLAAISLAQRLKRWRGAK